VSHFESCINPVDAGFYFANQMRALIQRVTEASVSVNGSTKGAISTGLLVFLGVSRTDTTGDADYLLQKVLGLRIFSDDAGKMNQNVQEVGGALLIISQFTLFGDCRRGRRPSFDDAAPIERAQELYNYFVEAARRGPVPVSEGVFQASMQVRLINDGPVTIWIDSAIR
jgi:D-tyrosyl-tRNA(Tyr) deacylase